MKKAEKDTLQVEGMTCTNCANTVTKRLEKLGLKDVNTNFLTGEVTFDANDEVDFEVISTAIDKLGYKVGAKKAENSSRIDPATFRFYFSLFFSVPLFLHMFLPHDSILNNKWLQLALCLPVYSLGFYHFGRSGWESLKAGAANMDVLVFIGSTAAFAYSLWGAFTVSDPHQIHQYLFFETTATIITLVFLGNLIEHRSVNQTTTAIRDLSQLQKVTAKKITSHDHHEHILNIPSEEIQKDDLLLVTSGDKIPTDAIIISGEGTIDEAMITGESKPVHKSMNDEVIGGTILLSGNLRIKAIRIGKETVLAQIIKMVKEAQASKPSIQKLGDKVSAIFVPVVIGIAALTFLLAFFAFQIEFKQAMLQSIAVLVISCPCAMGLATPTAIVAGIGRAAKNGILIKGGDTLERFSVTRKIVFDKTGTLTNGKFKLGTITIHSNDSLASITDIIYSIEQHSTHPIGVSLVQELKEKASNISFRKVEDLKGKGMKATDEEGNEWILGSSSFLTENTTGKPGEIYLLKNKTLVATISITDQVNPSAGKMISSLKKHHISAVMLSGDKNENCKAVADQLSITEWHGEQLPDQKLQFIKKQNQSNNIAMVGDGINDAPALASANIGISLGNATQVAISSAQIVILGDDLEKIDEAYLISKHTLITIRQNLFWAFFYNVIAIPIAALGFLNPMIAALSMAFSDVIVVGNSIRLKAKKLS